MYFTKMSSAALLCFFVLVGTAFGVSYEGYKVYKIEPKTETEIANLKFLEANPDFDFWSKLNHVGKPVSVMVAPKAQQGFENFLELRQLPYEILIENVERTVQAEKEYHQAKKAQRTGRITFDEYLRHDEINAYLAQLAEDYPDIVTLETIGQSYENRDMNLIRISSGSSSTKPAIFVDAGIHAREWIAPAVALYLINQLVENNATELYRDVDWIILPSVNPDGYEYCWTDDRLWRKTVSVGALCNGTDGNRNFDYHWMETGASNWECDEIFAGREAFSEIETRNLRDYILNSTANIQAYLSFHSFGQYVLYPWSYADILPDNAEELQSLGESIASAIENVRGTEYTVGSTTDTLYAAAGASHDWVKGVAGIDIALTIELPGGGFFGFDLPPSEAEGVAEETFEGLKVLGQYVANKFSV